jgi:hypothetical protein
MVNSHAFIIEASKGIMAVLYKRFAKIKLHRPGNLVRLVVSWQQAPEYRLSRCLIEILKATHTKANKRNIKSSYHPTSAEVKKMWIYKSTPTRLRGVVLN